MPITLPQYYDRFDSAQNYERHLFRAGNVLQSAELNELQSASMHRLQSVTDVLFKDGDVLSGAGLSVNATTGVCLCSAGAIYLRGAVRGVTPATLTVPITGLVKVGVYLNDSVVTELYDPGLRDPAISVRNYQEPGAARFKVDPAWGYDGDNQEGDFFLVYQIEDGLLLSKAPPPQVDATTLAIARYDRQSAGGYYISTGMSVTRLADENGNQIYSMADGVARVGGEEIIRQHARRYEYAAVPDTRTVSLEPHLAAGGTERVDVNFSPIHSVASIAVTKQETKTLTHGAIAGALDLIRDDGKPIVQIISVIQGETTYTQGAEEDYILTTDKVDWSSLTGDEPAPGSTYSITYQYIAIVAPSAQDATGFSVTGAVAGTLIQVTYAWSMPRFDIIGLNSAGDISIFPGVSAPQRPRVPSVPNNTLAVAVIDQQWSADTKVINNGVRMIPMNEINQVNTRIDTLFALMAEERLALNLTQKDSTAKKGIFTDAFYDDDMRDQGLSQNAAIFRNQLTLGVQSTAHTQTLASPAHLNARVLIEIDETVGDNELVVSQPLRTGSFKINEYNSFSPMPAIAVLTPAIDYWVDVQTNWSSPVARQFSEDVWTNPDVRDLMNAQFNPTNNAQFIAYHTTVTSSQQVNEVSTEKVGSAYVDLQFLRQITVQFNLSGFAPSEVLQTVLFDGQSVAFAEV